jgi:hypothetical protein
LASEWHPEKNRDLSPEDVWPKSNRKVWWQCSKGHEWQAVVASRAEGCGCPYCSGRFATKTNSLASKHSELLAEWDDEKNEDLEPSKLTAYSGKKAWWPCASGHSWQASISNRTRLGSGCPTCAQGNRRKYSIEDMQDIANERGGECLSTQYTSSRVKLKWRCKERHVWEARTDGILYQRKWCPVCARKR